MSSKKTTSEDKIINFIKLGYANEYEYDDRKRHQNIIDKLSGRDKPTAEETAIISAIKNGLGNRVETNKEKRLQNIKTSLSGEHETNREELFGGKQPFEVLGKSEFSVLSKNKDTLKNNAKEELSIMSKNGNVDLLNTPAISTKKLEEAGWGKQKNGYAAIYPKAYITSDYSKAILLTPILADGSVLSPQELDKYADDILSGKSADKNVLLGTFGGTTPIKTAEDYVQKVHNLQSVYYNQNKENENEDTKDDPNATSSKQGGVTDFAKIPSYTFEGNPTYEKGKEDAIAALQKAADEFKKKYGVDITEFNEENYNEWASRNGFIVNGKKVKNNSTHTKEEINEEEKLRFLVQRNEEMRENSKYYNEMNSVVAGGLAFTNSASFGLTKLLPKYNDWLYDYMDKNYDNHEYTKLSTKLSDFSLESNFKKVEGEHPVASAVGSGAAELLKLAGFGQVASKAVDGVSWLASKPEWIVSAIKSGLTFAMKEGANEVGEGGNIKDVAKEAGIGFVGGSVGGATGNAVGKLGENILFETGLQNKIIPEIARNGISASSFSLADTASTYFLHPEDERPTASDVAQNAAVSFAFAAISTAINTAQIKKDSKDALNYINERMVADFDKMTKSANLNDVEGVKKYAQNVIDYSKAAEQYLNGEGIKLSSGNAASDAATEYLTGQTTKKYTNENAVLKKARFIGEDKRVKSIQEDLRNIQNRANEFLEAANNKQPLNINNKQANSSSTVTSDTKTNSGNKSSAANVVTQFDGKTQKADSNINKNQYTSKDLVMQVPNDVNSITQDNNTKNSKVINNDTPTTKNKEIQQAENNTLPEDKSVYDILKRAEVNSSVKEQVSSLTESVSKTMGNVISSSPEDTTNMEDTNLKFISDKNNLFDKDYVDRYANDFVESLKTKNGRAYRDLSSKTNNIQGELASYILNSESELSGDPAFETTAEAFKKVLTDSVNKNAKLHNNVYGSNEVLEAQVNDIRNGNFKVMNISEKNTVTDNSTQVKESDLSDTVQDNENIKIASTNETIDSEEYINTGINNVSEQVKEGTSTKELGSAEIVYKNSQPISEVVVGDTFKNVKNGNTFSILSRDEKNTVVQIDTGVKTEQKIYTNNKADTLLNNTQFEKIETPVSVNISAETKTNNNTVSMPDGTKVVRVGDFYEAYGEDAQSLSNKLDLKITQKVINGEKVDMVGFPASSLENYKNVINNNISYTNNQNITKSSGKTKVVRAKKKDWVSHDVYWYAPKGKTILAYSTTSAKDLIDAMSEDNPTMTINDLHNAINYDEEAKKVLSAYINSGFGEEVASKHFGDNAKKYETVTNLAEIYSAGIEKADGGNQVPNGNDVTPQRTPETPLDSSSAADSILQKVEYIEKNAPILTNECELISTKHTKTGDNIWVVTLKNRLSADDFRDLNSRIKEMGGYYSRFGKTPEGKALPGFVFKSEPGSDVIKTINDFFDSAKTQKAAETNAIEHADETAADVQKDIPQLQKNYEKAVEEVAVDDEATARAKLENRTAIQVTEHTPDVILEYVKNSKDLPIIMNYSKLYLAVRKDGVVKGHYHNLGSDIAKKLPEMLSRPDVILMLPNGRLNILTDIQTDKGKNGIIAVELNSVKDIEGAYKKYNVVVTMFSSKDNYVKNLIGNGNNDIVYKREDLSQVNPQLYEWLAIVNDKSSLNNNVAQEGVFVKKNDDLLNNQQNDDILKEKEIMEDIGDVEQKSEVLAGESVSDDRGLRSTAKTTTTKRTETDSGQYRNNSGELLQDNVRAESSGSDVRNDGKRVHGGNDAERFKSETAGNSAEIADSISETIDTEVKIVEKSKRSNKGNFVITNDVASDIDNTLPTAKANIEAIELLIALENEGRPATEEEKKILAKYKGWGGIDTRNISYELNSRFSKLYDWEQRKAMQSSMNNAYFTPTKVIDAMYTGLKRMGFKGGNILETSMGIGNFFGRMPSSISSKSALTGIELESYTARIAQYLYPGATVINKPFQDVSIKNGSYDLVIGNVPFGTTKLTYNKKKYSLHNYFIISSLDKVKDGGVVAVITSAGTLDSYTLDARKAIMDRADVVACYKLPEKVFSRNADTDVQADLLILRKRANNAKTSGDSILNVVNNADGLRVNEYFVKHPENVLGILAKGTNAWGEITTVLDNGDFYNKLENAMKKLPKDLISGKVELKPIETIVSLSGKPRFFEKNGKIYSDDGAGTATLVTKREQVVRDYMAVRDAYKELLNAYELDKDESEIKPLRDTLSKEYDNFYKAHTAITGDGKKKIDGKKCKNNTFLESDSDYYLVSGLEYYNAKDGRFEKSALFEKDTLRKKRVTSVEAASDALAVSLNESGRIDFKRMQELTGKTEKQLAKELKGEIVLTPDGEYVLADIYLSGNIYEKLDAVKNKPEFREQQEMLEKVLPTPKDASSITVKLGANYIEPSYIQDFAREVLSSNIEVSKDNSGRWIIEGVRKSRYGDIVNVKYGCNAFNAIQLLDKILNDSEIAATKRVTDGGSQITIPDPEMTDIARQKAEDIKEAFENWIFKDSDRRTDIVNKYNRTYNNYRPLDYEHIAEKLSFDSMDNTLKSKLYPHQKKGIARFLFGGNILFAHGVGTGKTFEMIASVMEAKRMGIINKAAMVVPNNKVVDFKRDIAQAYPNAKVLVIDTANKKRQTMLGLVNSNDWDIVLIARTTFTKIPVSKELQGNFINQQLEDLEHQILLAESNSDISRRQLKGLITQRDNLENRLKELSSDTKRDENGVDFEKLGIDCICVDEAHNYKSILTPSKLDIKGLVNRSNAQMANDMLMKLDYIRSIDGRIIFGTGTPITNTVSEIYNMMRMVRPDILEDAGIHSLDEWVNTFAKIETNTEIGIDNKIKSKSTQIIRSFINASEMIGMFRQFADIVFTQDVVKNLPKAVYVDVELEGTDKHREIESQISEVIATAPKSELLRVYGQVMAMADAASVDLRMLSGADSEYNIFKDYSLDELEYEDSKINKMCKLVYEEYKKSNDIKGTQIIFCDKGSGSGTVYSFNLHKDIMQKLIKTGIPSDEIVIVKDQSDARLEELYEKVNNGEVRVLIGTSQKMAEGLNVQKRVVAIHHPTVTYKPSDWEQGNARGVRAGNINNEVRIYRYLQKNTFDSHKWQAQDRKGEMISRALKGEQISEIEDIGADDDGGASVDAATAMAITSGNPLVKEKIDIDKEVVRLKTLERNYKSERYRYEDAIAKNPGLIKQLSSFAENLEKDIALRDKYDENTVISIKDKTFDNQNKANVALSEAVKTAPKNGKFTKLGEFNGFSIMFKGDTGGMGYVMLLNGHNEYSIEYAVKGNNIARFAGTLKRLDAEKTRVEERVKTLKADLEFAKGEVKKPFEKETELAEALAKQKDVTYRYEHYHEKPQREQGGQNTVKDRDTEYSLKESNGDRNTQNKVNLTDKIVKGMSEKERYNILKDRTIDVVRYDNGKLKDLPKDEIEVLEDRYKKSAKKILKRIAEEFEIFKGYENEDIDLTFDYSRNSFRESVNKQRKDYLNFAKMLTVFDDVVKNAVGIEVHGDRYEGSARADTRLLNTYVLMSAFYDESDIIPVKMIVKELQGDKNKLYLAVSTKKIEAGISMQTSGSNDTGLTYTPPTSISNISLSEIFKKINTDDIDLLKYIPNDFLTAEQIKVKNQYASYNLKTDDEHIYAKKNDTIKQGENVSPHDIVSYISKTFDIPISTGNLRNRKAQGEFNRRAETIRVRLANDLPTVTHELGHMLNKKYDLVEMRHIDEAIDFAERERPTFMNLYEIQDRPNEAIAEFIREYLRNPEKVKRSVPNFYNEFIKAVDNKDIEALNTLSEYVQDYFNSDFRERIAASVITNKEIKKRDKSSLEEMTKKLYTKFVDDFAPIQDAVDYVEKTADIEKKGKNNAYVMAINSRNANSIVSFLLKTGMVDSNGKIISERSFIDCIKDIKPKKLKDFETYLILKHSIEWLEPKDGKSKNVWADEYLQDTDRIKQEIDKYEHESPEYVEAAKAIYEYQRNLLKYYLVDTGLMSDTLYDTLIERYPCYIPFMRDTGRKKVGAKRTFANQNTPISRAKGSGAAIISPIESIMRNTDRFVKAGLRNNVMGVLANYADTVDGFGNFMEEVVPDKIPHSISVVDKTERLKDVMSNLDEANFFALSDALDNIFGDALTSYTPVAIAGKQIVTYMQGGKNRYFQIHDTALYEAVANMSPRQIEGLRTFGKMLNATNLLITQFNYLFGFKNPIRDFDTALKHSKAYDDPFKYLAGYVSALKHIVTNSKEYKEYQAAGGGHMSNFSDSLDEVQRALNELATKDMNKARRVVYALFRHPIETMVQWNEITETIPRLAEYEGMKKKGADNQEAIYEASDVTTNFNRSGSTGRNLNKIFRFSNAQIQGLDKEFRTFTTGGIKSIRKYVIRYVLSALLTTALISFWNRLRDKDGWEELSQYQKNNFYCIALGDSHFIKIPKAREGAIPNTLLERTIDFVFGDEDAFYQFGEYLADTIMPSWLPLASLISGTAENGLSEGIKDTIHQVAGGTILSGVVDNMVNEDFKGTPIVPESFGDETPTNPESDTPKKKQTDYNTTWVAYALGQILNSSPLEIDHLIDSYTGIIGKINRAYGVMDKEQVDLSGGFWNTFTADSVYSTDTFNKVYEGRDKLSKKLIDNPTARNACLYEKYATAASFITKSNSIIRNMPNDEQREIRKKLIDDVKNFDISISDTDKVIAKSFDDEKVDYSYCVKNMPDNTITYTKKGVSYSYSMTYDEYRKYVSDYMEELNSERSKLIETKEYRNRSDAEKVELLKDVNSQVKSDVKDKYKQKFNKKFEKIDK